MSAIDAFDVLVVEPARGGGSDQGVEHGLRDALEGVGLPGREGHVEHLGVVVIAGTGDRRRAETFFTAWHLSVVLKEPSMKRIWSIEEQTFNDPASGFALEFTTDPADTADRILIMKLHNAARDKVLVLTFERNGGRLSSDVESVGSAEPTSAAVASAGVSDGAARVEENTEAMAGDIDRQGPTPEVDPPGGGFEEPNDP